MSGAAKEPAHDERCFENPLFRTPSIVSYKVALVVTFNMLI
jgi:hypothetical protein